MKNPVMLPVWAPRVKPHLICRLYDTDAQGIYDNELLEKVGWGLYARCESFILAMQAVQGKARCPACGAVIVHSFKAKEILHCQACGWECAWKDYYQTIRNQQLNGGPEVVDLFQGFVDQFPKAKSPQEKMLLIDQLIHGFHHFLGSGRTRRPAGINLIDGSLEFVMQFLDQLACGPGSSPVLRQTQADWQEKIKNRPR
jgi:predicted RNA-binding Zn-ribbon protein involved in translation (DUF1610 family)